MFRSPTRLVRMILLVLPAVLFGCGGSPLQTPQVVTVVNTVPVEVTRVVPVPQTVEVIREMIVTQIIEVPVTTTPAPTSAATSTLAPTATATFARLAATATPTFPAEKVAGFALLKITNENDIELSASISGPLYATYAVPARLHILRIVPEGRYTYAVAREGKVIYRGTMNITNPDKHELKLRADKAVFLVP